MAASSFTVESVKVEDIFVVGERRPVDDGAVEALRSSIKSIGLQTPITVRLGDVTDEDGEVFRSYILVVGAHRLEAYRRESMERIPTIVRDCDEVDAELWEIAENLHRSDLTKAQRDEQIRRYAELLTRKRTKIQVPQNEAPEIGYGKPPAQTKGVATQVAEQTGLSKSTVERALNPERVANERARSKVDADVKQRAAKEVAEVIAENVPSEWWDAVKANLYAAGASNIAHEFTNITGQSIMDGRYDA